VVLHGGPLRGRFKVNDRESYAKQGISQGKNGKHEEMMEK
jgi:hypothetical protein